MTLQDGKPFGIASRSDNINNGIVTPQKFSSKNFKYYKDAFNDRVQAQTLGGGAVSTSAGVANQLNTGNPWNILWEYAILGTVTTGAAGYPPLTATGLDLNHDNKNDVGAEYRFGSDLTATANARLGYTVGDDASFFAKLTFSIEDVSGTDLLLFGFGKKGAFNATLDTELTDYAFIGIDTGADPADVKIITRLNSGTATSTDTTLNWADTESHTWEVVVGADGVVNFNIDSTEVHVKAFTFDANDVVIPLFRFLNAAGLAGTIIAESLEIGYVPGRQGQ